MTARQRIVRVRRQYNQWVANQTLEDYALRFTAKGARRWSAWRVGNTAMGSISFLALEAIGGAITLSYGFDNAVAAILVVAAIILATGIPITYYAAKHGVDIDLLTRGAGFGYLGSTITSLIYASFTFIFFALEAAILAMALELLVGIPVSVGYLLSAVVVIPLVTYGITVVSRFQLWTQPVWLGLQILPFIFIAFQDPASIDGWKNFEGRTEGGGFNLLMFGAAAGVVFALIAQIGEQVDFLRFLPEKKGQSSRRRLAWWVAMLSAGPGWMVLGALKLLAGSFLVYFALSHGVETEHAAEPTRMYLALFEHVFSVPALALGFTGIFVVLSQVKINVTNAYAGSIAWSNFFSRLTHSHPGRVVWLVFNVAIAFLLMEFGIYGALEQILGLYSIVAIAWVGTIVADLVVNKPLGFSPPHIEFRRAHLYDINPVGLGSTAVATLAAGLAYFGVFGAYPQAFATFIALGVPFAAAPLIAWAGGRNFYLARPPGEHLPERKRLQCCICEYEFDREDMASCPAYGGCICSLCCSLDARCHDLCKTNARLSQQAANILGNLLPQNVLDKTLRPLGTYLAASSLTLLIIGAVLYLIYLQIQSQYEIDGAIIGGAFLRVFVIMVIVTGVAAWLFVLAQESRRVAQAESQRQTNLLINEIEAHKLTDEKLQKAKEAAEAANLAKSRYLVGISHEVRAPLNAIFGYAQLLERDADMPPHRREAIKVIRRSSEHLSGLIDGLLDISKIEAGHLHLDRNEVRLDEFLAQLVGMFSLQAQDKGVRFVFDPASNLPDVVYTDESRLRQILINLLSNAMKFTEAGQVTLRVRYRSQVAEFDIEDTGLGIRPEDIGRIFEPFERGRLPKATSTPGTGLGLTITKLLTQILGGEISVTSELGKGSRFRVRLLLSEVSHREAAFPVERMIGGYAGRRLTIMVADDDPAHRALVKEVLAPLGFTIIAAPDGETALLLAPECQPDLFLLDISMPGLSGWEVAHRLRDTGFRDARIIMVSANALEYRRERSPEDAHNDFLLKPLNISLLLERMASLLGLTWLAHPALAETAPLPGSTPLPGQHVAELRQLAEIGYVRGLQAKLEAMERDLPQSSRIILRLRGLVDSFDLNALAAALDRMTEEETSLEIS
ncbi:ATP-binding protein [Telmatospirillum sp. J64-1]|uniref:ATP-binding protein n=1 Tax=Telmatospirillum sp. J64-1 TaxID=2502183 RepID=UPI00115E0CB3|nr:ATP-binding protein [Telmatospirillum sp. J64-1]